MEDEHKYELGSPVTGETVKYRTTIKFRRIG